MYLIFAICMIVVMVAMAMDLIYGWRKATLRGEAHTSYAFSRTITKFLLYEGALTITCGMDTLVHFVWDMFVPSILYCVPCVSIIISMVLCSVEIWSMRENADDKTKRGVSNVIELAEKHLNKEQITEMLAEAIRRASK